MDYDYNENSPAFLRMTKISHFGRNDNDDDENWIVDERRVIELNEETTPA